ncbi:MAG: hypothetical protein ACYC3X_30295 [Pirellulaceae bacterium]
MDLLRRLDRPHRTAQLLHVPNTLGTVSLEQLQQVAGSTEPDPLQLRDGAIGNRWDIAGLLKQHDLAYTHRAEYDTEQGPADLFELQECPWHDEHSTGSGGAAIIQFPSGAVTFTCQHSHCAGRTWQDFKVKVLRASGLDVKDLHFGIGPTAAGVADFRLNLPRPVLDDSAYIGVLGEIAQAAGLHTESDPAAALMQLLVMFSVVAGRNAFFLVARRTLGRLHRGRRGIKIPIGRTSRTLLADAYDSLGQETPDDNDFLGQETPDARPRLSTCVPRHCRRP